jgi:hypothetical protein
VLCNLIVQPQIVMFLRPVVIDLAGPHRLERALHSERANIGLKREKGERIFYRKVVVACGQRQWRHIAFEYPAEAKRAFDSLVTSMSKALDRSVDAYCEDATVSRTLREPR